MLGHSTPPIDTILDRSGLLQTSLDLAARGIPCFPCLDTKAPACAGGFKAASTDPDTLRRVFASPAAVLIGVPTGAASGLDVLDTDPRNNCGAWLAAHEHLIPLTRIHATRSGGMHMLFTHQPGLRSSTGGDGGPRAGIDVKADGGYVIFWPAAGCQIVMDEEPAPWPATLIEALNVREPAAAPSDPANRRRLAPPSIQAAVDLFDAMPNPLHTTRDQWNAAGLAAAGCIHDTNGDMHGPIAEAFIGWAERGDDTKEPTREKWESDWSRRPAHGVHAGYDTLGRIARELDPAFRDPAAGAEFSDPLPPLPVPAAKPARRRVLAPGECEGVTSRPYRVKGLLAERDVGCLFGPPGAGKSLLAPLLAYRLAQGEAFFGMRTRSGPTLYVAAEDESGMERRINALRLAHGDADGFGLVKGVSDLLNPSSGDMAWFMAEVRDRKPALIVLDTLAMAFPGLIENDADAMGRVVAVARQLTEHGAAVLLVHHDSKARDGTPRGHSLLNGALDVAIALEPKDGAGVVRGRLTKNRNGSCEHEMAFRIGVRVLGADQDGDPITAAVAVELAAADAGVKPPRLSNSESAALAALNDLMRTDAVDAADGGQAVPEDAWLARCIPLSAAGKPEDRVRSANRVRSHLAQKGAVRILDGLVRPVVQAGRDERGRTDAGPTQGIEFVESDQAGPARTKPGRSGADSGRTGPEPIGPVRRSGVSKVMVEREAVP